MYPTIRTRWALASYIVNWVITPIGRVKTPVTHLFPDVCRCYFTRFITGRSSCCRVCIHPNFVGLHQMKNNTFLSTNPTYFTTENGVWEFLCSRQCQREIAYYPKKLQDSLVVVKTKKQKLDGNLFFALFKVLFFSILPWDSVP